MPTTAPHGSWRSPITTDLLTEGNLGLSASRVDGDQLYWLESRPSEAGRTVLVRRTAGGDLQDLTPAPYDVRSRVHEYGGGAYAVSEGTVVFCNFSDQRVYRIDPDGTTGPITPEGALRFADLLIDRSRQQVIAVREDHSEGAEPTNTLVALDLDADNADGGQVIFQGSDFLSTPALSPDGRSLAWLSWDHPNMPWDGTALHVAARDQETGQIVAGGVQESIFQPRWARSGLLYFLSDRSGWWNFHTYDPDTGAIEAVLPLPMEFGVPQWQFGASTYDFTEDDRIVCSFIDNGVGHLGVLDLTVGTLSEVDAGGNAFHDLSVHGDLAAMVVGYPDRPPAVVAMTVHNRKSFVVRRSSDLTLDAGYLSIGAPTTWTNAGGEEVHGFFYAPANQDFLAPPAELPPLIVMSHGGPTSMSDPAMKLAQQYWTSRGFAVLDVNYGGSTGYGRDYRRRLNATWGITDVEDCASGARSLADRGLVDGRRLAIRGGSAGGYTTLCAMVFTDVFAVGASHFGVGDLEALARDTHKFESRYLEGLIGPYPAAAQIYRERSPINHVDQLDCPLIILQGLEDKVVPPNQAETMAAAVRDKGIPVATVMFEGEGHGFRQGANIRRALEAELFFYGAVLGFELADEIPPVQIDNLS